MDMTSTEQQLLSQIPGMFGNSDYQFAIHPQDRERAESLLREAFFKNIPFEVFLSQCERHLKLSGCDNNHIKQQTERIINAKYNLYSKSFHTVSRRCWLVSKEQSIDLSSFLGIRTLSNDQIIAIENPRLSDKIIKDIINHHVTNDFTLKQRLAYMGLNNRQKEKLNARNLKVNNVGFIDLIIHDTGKSYIFGRKVTIKSMGLGETVTISEDTVTAISNLGKSLLD